MEAMPRRALLGLGIGIAASVAVGVALRLHTRDEVRIGLRVRPFDSDSAYHLRRARFAAKTFPRTILFDPLMNFPEGGIPIWPPLYDVALSLPARIAGGARPPAEAVPAGAAWVPVALAAGAIVLAALLGKRLRGGPDGVAAACWSTWPYCVQRMWPGQTARNAAAATPAGPLCSRFPRSAARTMAPAASATGTPAAPAGTASAEGRAPPAIRAGSESATS